MEDDAVLLVQGADEVAHLRTEDPLHRPFVRRHDMDFDAAGAQRGRDLEANEARAHHDRAARRLGSSMIALQSASERSVWTCGWSAPGMDRRTGSAPVASRSRS